MRLSVDSTSTEFDDNEPDNTSARWVHIVNGKEVAACLFLVINVTSMFHAQIKRLRHA